ncbi:hypothetical protein [Acaricomes phytoseiuli]|uniref:hypothetical protein n=1 Tax=Acaricomes phytoseiuli TaxID=291968 RepID=UPI0012E9EA83|nr:hypothetical protein [Acaricomes phytoseiuli]
MSIATAPPIDWDYTQAAPMYQAPDGTTPDQACKDLRLVIEHGINNQPRSLQKVIGPSEIGTECDHCLAARLAGWESVEHETPWLPFVGTAVHAQLEELVLRYENQRNAVNTTGRRYLAEARTMVGTIDGTEIWGSTDLVDLVAKTTFDYKVVGVTTLRSVKSGPSMRYRVQQQLYAKGWNDAGHPIEHVAIAYLPRNSISLRDAIWWHEPYNRQTALDALTRASQFAVDIRALKSLGEEAVTDYVTSQARAADCKDCHRYADSPLASPRETDIFAGLPTK